MSFEVRSPINGSYLNGLTEGLETGVHQLRRNVGGVACVFSNDTLCFTLIGSTKPVINDAYQVPDPLVFSKTYYTNGSIIAGGTLRAQSYLRYDLERVEEAGRRVITEEGAAHKIWGGIDFVLGEPAKGNKPARPVEGGPLKIGLPLDDVNFLDQNRIIIGTPAVGAFGMAIAQQELLGGTTDPTQSLGLLVLSELKKTALDDFLHKYGDEAEEKAAELNSIYDAFFGKDMRRALQEGDNAFRNGIHSSIMWNQAFRRRSFLWKVATLTQ